MNELSVAKYFTPDIVKRFVEVTQSRSAFQLEKFVLNQHETPEMQYVQLLLELRSLYYGLKIAELQAKKVRLEIDALRSTDNAVDEVEAQIKELGLEQMDLDVVSSFRELDILIAKLDEYPRYTRAQIEDAQPAYWEARLHRQAVLETLGGSPSAAAHLDSLRQIGVLEVTSDGVKEVTTLRVGSPKEIAK